MVTWYDEERDTKVCPLCCESGEMPDDVCDDCMDRERGNWQLCVEMSSRFERKATCEINAFLAYMFDEQDIEEILMAELQSRQSVDCSDYIDGDRVWFAASLLKIKEDRRK